MITSLAQLLMLWSFLSISWLSADTERGFAYVSREASSSCIRFTAAELFPPSICEFVLTDVMY